MKNCVLICLTLLSLKLLVNGKIEPPSKAYIKAVSLDLCEMPMDKGSCDISRLRYYYDLEKRKCLDFLYTGCGGNPNNFKTLEGCQKSCPGKYVQSRKPLLCYHSPAQGSCDGEKQSFYFDRRTNDCKKFLYGGCEGNSNRFPTWKKCVNHCRTYEFSLQLKPN